MICTEAKLDVQFPDEVDTPQHMLAKIRFQKYRGLESFRTSPWDHKENLPLDYGRIFQFENFDRTRKRIFQESQELEGALVSKQFGEFLCYNYFCVLHQIKIYNNIRSLAGTLHFMLLTLNEIFLLHYVH